jgi:hypothetical protein
MGRHKKEIVESELEFDPDKYTVKIPQREMVLSRILNGEEEQVRQELGDTQVDRLLIRYGLVRR